MDVQSEVLSVSGVFRIGSPLLLVCFFCVASRTVPLFKDSLMFSEIGRFALPRFVVAMALILSFFAFLCAPDPAWARGRKAPAENKKYADIVMDAVTGEILHQRNADKPLHPASLTKMMTLLMTFDALEDGRIHLNDRIPVSAHAASMVPSKLGLKPGSTIRVEDAIYALVTKSANDVAVTLAESLGGTERRFAGMMTRRAKALGMSQTNFRNASGLHHSAQVSTARDMARLARYIIRERSRYYGYFSTKSFTYKGDTYHNHNRLMGTYRGMDGMKTGYTVPSGFNLVASAVRGDRRLIGVVFGGRSAASRNARMAALLDEAFALPESGRGMALAGLAPDVVAPVPGLKPTDRAEDDDAGDVALADMGEGVGDASIAGDDDIRSRPPEPSLRKRTDPSGAWSIQVGAYGNKKATGDVLRRAVAALPSELAHVTRAEIASSRGTNGTIFRARLSGYDRNQAIRACRHFRDCLVIAPRGR